MRESRPDQAWLNADLRQPAACVNLASKKTARGSKADARGLALTFGLGIEALDEATSDCYPRRCRVRAPLGRGGVPPPPSPSNGNLPGTLSQPSARVMTVFGLLVARTLTERAGALGINRAVNILSGRETAVASNEG